jgi:hypothetical protein
MMTALDELKNFCFEHGGALKAHMQFGELCRLATKEQDEYLSIIKDLRRDLFDCRTSSINMERVVREQKETIVLFTKELEKQRSAATLMNLCGYIVIRESYIMAHMMFPTDEDTATKEAQRKADENQSDYVVLKISDIRRPKEKYAKS